MLLYVTVRFDGLLFTSRRQLRIRHRVSILRLMKKSTPVFIIYIEYVQQNICSDYWPFFLKTMTWFSSLKKGSSRCILRYRDHSRLRQLIQVFMCYRRPKRMHIHTRRHSLQSCMVISRLQFKHKELQHYDCFYNLLAQVFTSAEKPVVKRSWLLLSVGSNLPILINIIIL